jgi:hypothetical protein
MCFARDMNRTPRDCKSPVLPHAVWCTVPVWRAFPVPSSLGTDVMAYTLFIIYVLQYCIVPILLFINRSVGNRQLPIPQYVCCSQCCLTWKNPGCHWTLFFFMWILISVCLWLCLIELCSGSSFTWGWIPCIIILLSPWWGTCWKCILCCWHVLLSAEKT